jgi:hypothetical protein
MPIKGSYRNQDVERDHSLDLPHGTEVEPEDQPAETALRSG